MAITNAALAERIKYLEERVVSIAEKLEELMRSVRGNNGNVGIIGILDRVQARLNDLERKINTIEQDTKALDENINGLNLTIRGIQMNEPKHEEVITFRWLMEKVVLPLFLPIIGGAMTYIIMQSIGK